MLFLKWLKWCGVFGALLRQKKKVSEKNVAHVFVVVVR
jgi:hypothetical protein